MEWYYLDNQKQQVGPISDSEIQNLISKGTLQRSTMVWNESMTGWLSVAQTQLNTFAPKTPPPVPPIPPVGNAQGFGIQTDPNIDPRISFAKDPNMVYPANPPRSVGWMTFWGFIWPGLGQVLCGQGAKGGALMLASLFLVPIIGVMTASIGALAICIAGAIDANKVAKALASGQPVKKWEFFPKAS